jgi:hypothetical protein
MVTDQLRLAIDLAGGIQSSAIRNGILPPHTRIDGLKPSPLRKWVLHAHTHTSESKHESKVFTFPKFKHNAAGAIISARLLLIIHQMIYSEGCRKG